MNNKVYLIPDEWKNKIYYTSNGIIRFLRCAKTVNIF